MDLSNDQLPNVFHYPYRNIRRDALLALIGSVILSVAMIGLWIFTLIHDPGAFDWRKDTLTVGFPIFLLVVGLIHLRRTPIQLEFGQGVLKLRFIFKWTNCQYTPEQVASVTWHHKRFRPYPFPFLKLEFRDGSHRIFDWRMERYPEFVTELENWSGFQLSDKEKVLEKRGGGAHQDF